MARKAAPGPAAPDPLATYNAKRDFGLTAEPAGQLAAEAGNLFMVQKHDATRLHWDFRLELDGVLKSWAVTRGPSPDPADKRLAVRTEDHPLAYATFEGTIPAGQYGGGTVMLWDRGTWTPVPGKDPRKTLAEGHLHFMLDGERMKGEWLLIRLKPRGRERHENWLLRKVHDAFDGASGDLVDRALTSVATRRTMAQIAAGEGGARQWQSKAGDALHSHEAVSASPGKTAAKPTLRRQKPATAPKAETATTPKARSRRKADQSAPPDFVAPQLATLSDHVPSGSGWLHEMKYDGYRTLIAVGGGQAKAYTRTGLDWSDRFASLVAAAARALPGPALIDGEVVALDAGGRPNFQALQASLKEGTGTLAFFAFDLLQADGEDLTGLPNLQRKERLAALLDGVEAPLFLSQHVQGQGEALFAQLCREGLEGIVSKRADAPYLSGRRVEAWCKVKCLKRQEMVVVGWLPSDKSRGFRSLLLAWHDAAGELTYAGKVGTGFSQAVMEDLLARMAPLESAAAPVSAPRAAVRGAHWLDPSLVVEVAYATVTDEGLLRHASYIGLREDKPASEVVREAPAATAGEAAGDMPHPSAPAVAGPDFGVTISHRERVIFPESGITKGQLADYYQALAGPVLDWAANRPISLVRCPQGRAKHCFFQKHDAGSFGAAVRHLTIPGTESGDEAYLYLDDGKGLLTCVQMGAIEIHGWGSTVAAVERPDRLVFDLDPDEGLDFTEVRHAAMQLRDVLGEMGLASWPMLSGGKGVHVVVPLDQSRDWPAVKDFARRFALAVSEAHPKRFTANMKKTERRGRIFLDWLRNQRGATAVMPYGVRARPNAPVAAPIGWDELETADTAARFTIADAAELLRRAGSKALAGWARADQALPEL